MAKKDPRIDAYIAKSADFAKPILTEIRAVVHDVCPNVEETMKWSFPHFDYKGMMCSMAAFKQHCALGFWKASLILDGNGRSEEAMGQFGRITALSDLSKRTRRRSTCSRPSAPVTVANTWSGSPRRKARTRASAASPRQSSGWRRASPEIGSTSRRSPRRHEPAPAKRSTHRARPAQNALRHGHG